MQGTGALAAGAFGGLMTLGGTLAQAASETPISQVGLWLQGGGTATLAGALVYVVKKLLNGELVPRATDAAIRDLQANVLASGHREDATMELAQKVNAREEKLFQVLADCNHALHACNAALGGPDARSSR